MCIQQDGFGDVLTSITSVFMGFTELYEQKAIDDYQNKRILEQAKQAGEEAARERQEGIEEARNKRLQAILNMGDEKVSTASGNIAISSLTTINQLDNVKLSGELDAINTLKDANRRSESYIRQADNLYSDYALGRFNSKRKFRNGIIKQTEKTAQTAVKIAALI